ncbi:uncharacterized protein BO72DRAFT_527439 [Aspergillus fijiensis CBS 313.89]|uniref:Uncharacterized protein n=1 Tax=Aspergillus fijiensis CBS 313.89 TaxID=1448319 RepID=A0A8G1RTJ9_9EURO|nr:uncharacterized protein BO72DRAFT_527439 [Aspergillus fijiensis CBS 313.89]RAK77590.1 hypothetical protein BO72DRAFT_527439 [Aspergillus fijiensis CBS 313.89]
MTPSRATQVHDDHSHKRTSSSSSSSAYSRKSTEDYRRYSGTVNHCGRHSNDWLFGGFSLRDTWGDTQRKTKNTNNNNNTHDL